MIVPIAVVYLATRLFWWASTEYRLVNGAWSDGAIKLAIWVPTSLLVVMALRRQSLRDTFGELGLTAPAWRGTALMIAVTLPMMALALSGSRVVVRPPTLISDVLLGPFAEEVLYRGFLFQQLWHRARWPVWGAALGSAMVFALAHHQDLDETLLMGLLVDDLATPLSILAPPVLSAVAGGCLFAWITWRWRSLWPAIALHGAVNFWWDISVRPDDIVAAVSQGLALALAVGLTWALTRTRVQGSGFRVQGARTPNLEQHPEP